MPVYSKGFISRKLCFLRTALSELWHQGNGEGDETVMGRNREGEGAIGWGEGTKLENKE